MSAAPSCAACRHWRRYAPADVFPAADLEAVTTDDLPEDDPKAVIVGQCRRNPPAVSDAVPAFWRAEGRDDGRNPAWVLPLAQATVWPVTWADEWCGEFSPPADTAPKEA